MEKRDSAILGLLTTMKYALLYPALSGEVSKAYASGDPVQLEIVLAKAKQFEATGGFDDKTPTPGIGVPIQSPLTEYVNFLVSFPTKLSRAVERDAEAIRILTDMALPYVLGRSERLYWNRRMEAKDGGIIALPRIWTRRDERTHNLRRGFDGPGFHPPRRAERLIARIVPTIGLSLNDALFRQAIDEARRDGTASTLCSKLEFANDAFGKMLNAAREISWSGDSSEFHTNKRSVKQAGIELIPWTKQTAIGNADHCDKGTKAPKAVKCYVTLIQMASIVNKSKRTLERLRNDGKLPKPAVKGGNGKADEWQWRDVRPILEETYNRPMPEVFPADCFVR